MSTAKHTPGPWVYSGRLGFGHLVSPNIAVAYGGATSGRQDSGEANARLIAAAPEMYEALKLVMQHGRIDDSEHRMNLVAAAIAKAEAQK